MRPQHITAENASIPVRDAALRRASMRPQHITAENLCADVTRARGAGCFNEAAAYHCGKRAFKVTASRSVDASMRPQHITAENPQDGELGSDHARRLQ